ncbi:hypothetical protein IWZ00DRAFT_93335 [Phyllosticta capitalensis]
MPCASRRPWPLSTVRLIISGDSSPSLPAGATSTPTIVNTTFPSLNMSSARCSVTRRSDHIAALAAKPPPLPPSPSHRPAVGRCCVQNVFLFHVDTTADATGISSRHWAKWARVAMRSTPARVLAVIHAQKFKDDQAKCIGRQRWESWKFDQEVIQLGHIEVAMDDMDSAVAEDLVYVTASPGLQPLLHPLSSTTTMKKPQCESLIVSGDRRCSKDAKVGSRFCHHHQHIWFDSESDAVVAARSTSDYEDDTDDTTTWRQTRRAGRPHTTALAPAAPFAPVPASPPRVRAPTSQRAAARSALNASSFKKSMPPDVLRCVINGTLPRVFANHSLPAATKFISLTNEEMRISPVRIGGKLVCEQPTLRA